MITVYRETGGRLVASGSDLHPLEGVVWIDLHSPDTAEEKAVEAALGLGIPTRADMEEIESSSRAYAEGGAYYLTAQVMASPEGRDPELGPVTCVVTPARLVTVRYHAPGSIAFFAKRAEAHPLGCQGGLATLMALMETIVDRQADILEGESRKLDVTTRAIFEAHRPSGRMQVLSALMQRIGRAEDLNGKIDESLSTLARLVLFLTLAAPEAAKGAEKARLKTLARDIRSLLDAAAKQERKITFQLDATLGVINIRQADVIKIFSVVAFVFLPPTLIASIYGMNFDVMPELHWPWGYPMALAAMAVSALVPYLIFRWKRWL
ncbi:magnesium/cobalt transporter CorA [Rhodobacter sp.]